MKKIHLSIIVGLLLCLCISFFTGCNKITLSPPENLTFEETTQTLSWDKVKDARFYTVYIEGAKSEKRDTSKNSVELEDLPEGNYEITVQACGREEEANPSERSEVFRFYREKEPNMKFTLINRNTEYEVSGKSAARDETGVFVIPDTYRGKPVTSIGEKSFFNKSDVKSVVVGKNVKSVGKQAFANCINLTSVTFNDRLTTIDDRAFQNCRLLAGDVVIPDSVTKLGANSFSGCESVTSFTIGAGIKEVANHAFSGCKGLTAFTIPDTVTQIGEYAFSDNEKLTSIKISDKVKEIGKGAFAHNLALATITLPDGVEIVGEGAFQDCSALQEVIFGSSVRQVKRNAFKNTKIWTDTPLGAPVYVGKWLVGFNVTNAEGKEDKTIVTSLTVEEGTLGIADYAAQLFLGIKGLIELPNSVKYIGECSFNAVGAATVVLGEGVETIGIAAFSYSTSLKDVILGGYDWDNSVMTESSLTTIENNAFIGCEKLEKIDIPETVTKIGSYVFRKTALYKKDKNGVVYAGNWVVDCNPETVTEEVEILDGTRAIASYAFYDCEVLEKVVLPDSVVSVGNAAFYKCRNLSKVTLPVALERIEDYTFYKCKNLAEIQFPMGLQYIGRSAFYECKLGSLETDTKTDVLTIPNTVQEIGAYAFYKCGYSEVDDSTGETTVLYGIDRVIVGNGVTKLGDNAFSGFVSLQSVTFGSGLTYLPERAFYKCPNLTSVTFGHNMERIGERAFYECGSLKTVSFTDQIKEIERNAFYKCVALESVDFNEVETLGDYAFYGCEGLKTLAFPESLKTVGKQTFRNCTGLLGIALPEGISLGDHAFYGCSSLTVYAEAAAKEEGWSKNWNSTFRPIVWGCTLSKDKSYAYSFTKGENSVANLNNSNQLVSPVRTGYTFEGWAFDPESTVCDYTTEELPKLANGLRLYTIWRLNAEE